MDIKQAFDIVNSGELSRAERGVIAEIFFGSYNSCKEQGLEIALEDLEIREGRKEI